jgi:NhaA family Na+:H+ antiporter
MRPDADPQGGMNAALAPLRSVQSAVQQFLGLQSAGGILLVAAALLATVLINMPFATGYYRALLRTPVVLQIGDLGLAKPLLLWVNDGLMAIFFFLVGLELKREFLEGELASRDQALLPAIAAVGGMLVPALVYWAINAGDPVTLKGWAIPAATDIAFAVGVLALLGDRVPASLKVFLLALAIMDDLGAIVIIALFYSTDLSEIAVIAAIAALGVLFALNRLGVMRPTAYYLVGVALWLAVLKSGVHAPLAGVLCALF